MVFKLINQTVEKEEKQDVIIVEISEISTDFNVTINGKLVFWATADGQIIMRGLNMDNIEERWK